MSTFLQVLPGRRLTREKTHKTKIRNAVALSRKPKTTVISIPHDLKPHVE
jgi:hypothetical protein